MIDNSDSLRNPDTLVLRVEEVGQEVCSKCGKPSPACLRITASTTIRRSELTSKQILKTVTICPQCVEDKHIEALLEYSQSYLAEIRSGMAYEGENVIKYKDMLLCPYHFMKTLEALDIQSIKTNEISSVVDFSCDMCMLDNVYFQLGIADELVQVKAAERLRDKRMYELWKIIKTDIEKESTGGNNEQYCAEQRF